MFDSVELAHQAMREVAQDLDPARLDPRDAKRLVEELAEMERLVVAAKTLCLRRVTVPHSGEQLVRAAPLT